MKKLTVILFENELENKEYSNLACERFSDLPPQKEFCGIWGEIVFNSDEVLSMISTTVNHFIDNTDKSEIVFGCCKKDYNAIITKIHTENWLVEELSCKNL